MARRENAESATKQIQSHPGPVFCACSCSHSGQSKRRFGQSCRKQKMGSRQAISHLSWSLFCVLSFHLLLNSGAFGCRVGSEKLKFHTKHIIEQYLDAQRLESIFWPEESLDASSLSKVTGIHITQAKTRFNLDDTNTTRTSSNDGNGIGSDAYNGLLQDIFTSCSADKHRSYTLTMNLELNNPFKVIDLHYEQDKDKQQIGLIRIRLAQSRFLVQLSQRISYDECLEVNYVQLSPAVAYEIDCLSCNEEQRGQLDKIFGRRMSQFDAELDSILSEKLLFGIKSLLSQQRLDLDLYLS